MRWIKDFGDIEILGLCRNNPMVVPIVVDGSIMPVRGSAASDAALRLPLSVRDYDMGLEALGWTVGIDENGEIETMPPRSYSMPAWQEHAERIQRLFEHRGDDEIREILNERL